MIVVVVVVVVECYCFLIIIIVDHVEIQSGNPYCKSQYILCRHSKTVTTPQTKRWAGILCCARVAGTGPTTTQNPLHRLSKLNMDAPNIVCLEHPGPI